MTLVHEEGNRFLPTRNSNSNQPIIEENFTSDDLNTSSMAKINLNNKSIITENIFNSSLSNANTPQLNFKNRKIILQPLPSNSPKGSLTNSPVEYFNPAYVNKNNKRLSNVSLPSQSSPATGVFSPKTRQNFNSYSSKLASKPTLFDYITTPNKSPIHHAKPDAPALINDFKNRFQQHQQFLQQQQQMQQQGQIGIPPKTPQSPLVQQPIVQNETQTNDVNKPESRIKKDYSKLGETLKDSLSAEDIFRLSLLSSFYSQLILSKSQ